MFKTELSFKTFRPSPFPFPPLRMGVPDEHFIPQLSGFSINGYIEIFLCVSAREHDLVSAEIFYHFPPPPPHLKKILIREICYH